MAPSGSLGEILLARSLLDQETLERALDLQRSSGRSLEIVLVEEGFIEAEVLRGILRSLQPRSHWKVLGLGVVLALLAIPVGRFVNPASKPEKIELIRIRAGTFLMGSKGWFSWEMPVHPVTIRQDFLLGRTEVTQAQWKAVMGSNPSRFQGSNRPVESVSWDEVQEFLRKLNLREGRSGANVYRLPSEAEWEYACRAGTVGDFSPLLDTMGWFESNGGGQSHPIGKKKPNAWGLYDIHGNVWEWC